jgi:hypothetical protein
MAVHSSEFGSLGWEHRGTDNIIIFLHEMKGDDDRYQIVQTTFSDVKHVTEKPSEESLYGRSAETSTPGLKLREQ